MHSYYLRIKLVRLLLSVSLLVFERSSEGFLLSNVMYKSSLSGETSRLPPPALLGLLQTMSKPPLVELNRILLIAFEH
jgi:hypothetical protein